MSGDGSDDDNWVSDSVGGDDAGGDAGTGGSPDEFDADTGDDGAGHGHGADAGSHETDGSGTQAKGPDEKFCAECGAVINAKAEVCPECGVRQPDAGSDDDERLIAALLAIFLGGIGAHKFYLGQTKLGVLYLCFFWTAIPAIIGIIEGVIYLSKSDEEFRRQYLDG